MAGTLLNSPENHEENIRAWMNAVVRDGGIERYDDLHVDQIDPNWKAKAVWVSAGLESLEHAVGIRNAEDTGLSVVLAFSLESADYARGLDFSNLPGLEDEFDVTPPSLYLFRPGTEFWTQAAEYVDIRDVNSALLFGQNAVIKRCVYMEFKRFNSDEYTRSLFVTG